MRKSFVRAAALLALLVLVLPPAFAADEAHGGQTGLMDFDLFSAISSIVVFVILLIVLTLTAWKPILKGLQSREQAIQKALDDAAAAHEQAKALIADYEGRIENARREAQAIFEEARKDADNIRRQIEADARAQSDQVVERAKREISQLEDKAWESLMRDAAQIAVEAARAIIEREVSIEQHATFVNRVVRDFVRGPALKGAPANGKGKGA
jgi:F-type H+-transporting ATPase subunit b